MRADRLLSIMLLLQHRGHITAEDLAAHLEVSVRTIYRDVEALCIAGVPIYTQCGPHGGVFLDADYRVELTGLSRFEVQSLAVEGAAQPLSDLGLGGAVEVSYLKLLAALPGIQRTEAEQIRQRIYLDPKGWFQVDEHLPYLATVQQAVMGDEEIELLYEKAGGDQIRRYLQPYGLVCKSNIWYMVGKTEGESWRTYRVSRFRGVRLSGKHFERERDFQLKRYWEESRKAFENQFRASYPACLRVHPDLLAYFEWYFTGRFEHSDEIDERGWLELQILFYSQQEARMTVMGLGTQVEIVEPQDLQNNVLETARAWIAKAQA